MAVFELPLTTLVLGIATGILALSLFVQVLQEVWKFLTSSRARCYTDALEDFLGPWARRLTRPGILPDFQARGPFQLRRLGPTGVLLPLGKPELVEGLERTTSPWIRRGLRALRVEADLQAGTPQNNKLSSQWGRFIEEMNLADSGKSGDRDYQAVREFLQSENLHSVDPSGTDAARVLRLYRERFIPHVTDAERHFGRLGELFEFRWRRRNLRQTFILGFVVSFMVALPIQEIYRQAANMSEEETLAYAEQTMQLYRSHKELFAADTSKTDSDTNNVARRPATERDSLRAAELDSLQKAVSQALKSVVQGDTLSLREKFNGFAKFTDARLSWPGRLLYVLGCLLTALLVSFGAPFWNDIVGAIWRLKQNGDSSRGATKKQPSEGEAS